MINNKGDVPITILVLGTFVICSLALLSFFVSNAKIGQSFVGIDLMEKMDSKSNEYDFYTLKGVLEDQIQGVLAEEGFYIVENVKAPFFEINESETNFKFAWGLDPGDWSEEKLLFSCKYYLPKA